MEVILLERVAKLGQMGEVVSVKDGFARNFLLKRGKALRATAENRAKYDGMKAELEANNLKAKSEATKVAEKIDGRDIVIIRQASETGQLFGSVTVRDIVVALAADGVTVDRTASLAGFADQGDRPAEGDDRRAPRSRDQHHGYRRTQRRMKPSASSAARTSRPVRKTRTPPPKRSPPPANSSIRMPSMKTMQPEPEAPAEK